MGDIVDHDAEVGTTVAIGVQQHLAPGLVDLGDQAGAVAIEGVVFAELDRPVGQLGEVAPVDALALVPMGRSCRRF